MTATLEQPTAAAKGRKRKEAQGSALITCNPSPNATADFIPQVWDLIRERAGQLSNLTKFKLRDDDRTFLYRVAASAKLEPGDVGRLDQLLAQHGAALDAELSRQAGIGARIENPVRAKCVCKEPATEMIGNLPVCAKCAHADRVFGIRPTKRKK